eukprot:g9649.t1
MMAPLFCRAFLLVVGCFFFSSCSRPGALLVAAAAPGDINLEDKARLDLSGRLAVTVQILQKTSLRPLSRWEMNWEHFRCGGVWTQEEEDEEEQAHARRGRRGGHQQHATSHQKSQLDWRDHGLPGREQIYYPQQRAQRIYDHARQNNLYDHAPASGVQVPAAAEDGHNLTVTTFPKLFGYVAKYTYPHVGPSEFAQDLLQEEWLHMQQHNGRHPDHPQNQVPGPGAAITGTPSRFEKNVLNLQDYILPEERQEFREVSTRRTPSLEAKLDFLIPRYFRVLRDKLNQLFDETKQSVVVQNGVDILKLRGRMGGLVSWFLNGGGWNVTRNHCYPAHLSLLALTLSLGRLDDDYPGWIDRGRHLFPTREPVFLSPDVDRVGQRILNDHLKKKIIKVDRGRSGSSSSASTSEVVDMERAYIRRLQNRTKSVPGLQKKRQKMHRQRLMLERPELRERLIHARLKRIKKNADGVVAGSGVLNHIHYSSKKCIAAHDYYSHLQNQWTRHSKLNAEQLPLPVEEEWDSRIFHELQFRFPMQMEPVGAGDGDSLREKVPPEWNLPIGYHGHDPARDSAYRYLLGADTYGSAWRWLEHYYVVSVAQLWRTGPFGASNVVRRAKDIDTLLEWINHCRERWRMELSSSTSSSAPPYTREWTSKADDLETKWGLMPLHKVPDAVNVQKGKGSNDAATARATTTTSSTSTSTTSQSQKEINRQHLLRFATLGERANKVALSVEQPGGTGTGSPGTSATSSSTAGGGGRAKLNVRQSNLLLHPMAMEYGYARAWEEEKLRFRQMAVPTVKTLLGLWETMNGRDEDEDHDGSGAEESGRGRKSKRGFPVEDGLLRVALLQYEQTSEAVVSTVPMVPRMRDGSLELDSAVAKAVVLGAAAGDEEWSRSRSGRSSSSSEEVDDREVVEIDPALLEGSDALLVDEGTMIATENDQKNDSVHRIRGLLNTSPHFTNSTFFATGEGKTDNVEDRFGDDPVIYARYGATRLAEEQTTAYRAHQQLAVVEEKLDAVNVAVVGGDHKNHKLPLISPHEKSVLLDKARLKVAPPASMMWGHVCGGVSDAFHIQSTEISQEIFAKLNITWVSAGGSLIQKLRYGGRSMMYEGRRAAPAMEQQLPIDFDRFSSPADLLAEIVKAKVGAAEEGWEQELGARFETVRPYLELESAPVKFSNALKGTLFPSISTAESVRDLERGDQNVEANTAAGVSVVYDQVDEHNARTTEGTSAGGAAGTERDPVVSSITYSERFFALGRFWWSNETDLVFDDLEAEEKRLQDARGGAALVEKLERALAVASFGAERSATFFQDLLQTTGLYTSSAGEEDVENTARTSGASSTTLLATSHHQLSPFARSVSDGHPDWLLRFFVGAEHVNRNFYLQKFFAHNDGQAESQQDISDDHIRAAKREKRSLDFIKAPPGEDVDVFVVFEDEAEYLAKLPQLESMFFTHGFACTFVDEIVGRAFDPDRDSDKWDGGATGGGGSGGVFGAGRMPSDVLGAADDLEEHMLMSTLAPSRNPEISSGGNKENMSNEQETGQHELPYHHLPGESDTDSDSPPGSPHPPDQHRDDPASVPRPKRLRKPGEPPRKRRASLNMKFYRPEGRRWDSILEGVAGYDTFGCKRVPSSYAVQHKKTDASRSRKASSVQQDPDAAVSATFDLFPWDPRHYWEQHAHPWTGDYGFLWTKDYFLHEQELLSEFAYVPNSQVCFEERELTTGPSKLIKMFQNL